MVRRISNEEVEKLLAGPLTPGRRECAQLAQEHLEESVEKYAEYRSMINYTDRVAVQNAWNEYMASLARAQIFATMALDLQREL